jgi:hypothetical protein
MPLNIFLTLQIFMGLWTVLNGFIAGEMGWIYSMVLWLVGTFLLIGGYGYWTSKSWGRKVSLGGMLGLALISGSALVYSLYLIFRNELNFGFAGLYPFGIFAYSIAMFFYYLRESTHRNRNL